eukprot:gnl/Spiro4/10895_TR5801_c0_g1_i1.p1 gnl/Spiro4/10895_TR5801_c0_g1~~gnl/Spiro4/10895_TR5801_c0_g1_i1.p1  ORF type:complete len:209 (+),score=39.66 gnl/Spiro4/10895_TR5801_c0_g1_i1:43-627(+)
MSATEEQIDHEASADGDGVDAVDLEIEAMKARVRELEEDTEKLRKLQDVVAQENGDGGGADGDSRSVFVANVDWNATIDEVRAHFSGCGNIELVTIPVNKYTGRPKGCAYVRFENVASVEAAMALSDSTLRDRVIKVVEKRTNIPGMSQDRFKGVSRALRPGTIYRSRFASSSFRPRGRGIRRPRGFYPHPYYG